MTESEWLTCDTKPAKMLSFVTRRTSDRKLRLYMCACARFLWSTHWEASGLKAVEAAEAHADGMLGTEEMEATGRQIIELRDQSWPAGIVRQICFTPASHAAWSVNADCHLGRPRPLAPERRAEALRCIFWPARFRTIAVDPAWRTWNDDSIVKQAQAIYETRDLPRGHLDAGRLPILADALEEAGCTDEAILAHCRGPGPHVRGCWVVDLILGKK
jgi:hypothetical protein